jgi:hypothetical protein
MSYEWRKSSYSSGGDNCVEVASTETGVLVRDDKLGDDSPVLEFTNDEWSAFKAGVINGEF